MPTEKQALDYASKGFKILPIWFPNKDGSCPCNIESCTSKESKSRGKHPVGALTPRGLTDATRDMKTITQWFQSGMRLNIGVLCGPLDSGRNLVVFDVDNTKVARDILERDLASTEGLAVATTGRGCHIYLLTDTPVQTHDVYLAGHKEKVGEVRGTGAYVVAPPSRHYSGVRYRWVGQAEDDPHIPSPTFMADVDTFVGYICGKAGHQVEPPVKRIIGDRLPPGTAVEPIDLPFVYNPMDHNLLWQYLEGNFPSDGDRSKLLWHIAKEIRNVAIELGENITGEQIQGVIKQVDKKFYHKYTRRQNADKEYWRIVWGEHGVLISNGETIASTADFKERPEEIEPGMYEWRERQQRLLKPGDKSDLLLANCKPIIEEVLEIDDGDKVSAAYNISFVRATGSISWQVTPKTFADPRLLHEEFESQATQTDFIVYPDGWKHVSAAAREISRNVKHRRVYQHTGWIDAVDGRAFVLPGAAGAITEDDIDHSLAYNNDPNDHVGEKLKHYGVGVRPIITAKDTLRAEEALGTLIQCAPPEIIVPIIVQVVSGPLASYGLMADPPLMHIMGRTGSMKTSLATAALSMFGQFDRTSVPETWVTTVNGLQASLYAAKDITLLIDDYKHDTAPKVTSIIQAYSDRVGRSRMGKDQKIQVVQRPRGLLLSTGEDVWSSDESTTARTIRIDMHRGMVNTNALTRVQERYIPRGWLQLIGGSYISWLIGFEGEELSDTYLSIRRKITLQLQSAADPETHQRMIGLLAGLVSSGRMFERFLKERLPGIYADFKDAANQAWLHRLNALQEQAQEAREQGPFSRLINTLRQCVLTKEVRLLDVETKSKPLGGGFSARTVGYYDNETIYLNEANTWHWFAERYRQQGEDAPSNWQSVVKDAEATVQGAHRKHVIPLRRTRFLCIPRGSADLGESADMDVADIVGTD